MDVRHSLTHFIEAFEALDLEKMMEFFSEDATMFFPIHHYSSKVKGKSQITLRFEDVINKIKAAGVSRIDLPVGDLDIANYGETAVASFHVKDKDLSRRSIVLRNTGNGWLITHFHASNAPLEEK